MLLTATGGSLLRAQTNTETKISVTATNKAKAAPAAPRAPTQIYSDSFVYDPKNARTATYIGHVRVDDPQMKLTCARLIVDLPQPGGRINRIVAETNVVIDSVDDKGQTNLATSDKAVYDYSVQNGVTNETVTLTGNPQPQMENAQGTQAADAIVWDRASGGIRFYGNYHMVSHQNFGDMTGSTNSPATGTNKLSAPK
jgi:lipopolysaccharide export system protein LptA